MMRLVFEAEDFGRLQATPCPDGWVRLCFPDAACALPRRPHLTGRLEGACILRRIAPPGAVTIDILRPDRGLTAVWAARARPGDRLLMSQPEGRFRLPAGSGRLLAFADITGLPARPHLSAGIALPR
ncbi:siderophore-interacting protein [Rhodovulum sp. YEN HP10]|uniref:siderophore-interacting protein n=1 Tax=Rhodovulum sp. HP10 TaxID=3387397 RepID=UPI0039DF31E2